jgi:outer membrane immunogenic protein
MMFKSSVYGVALASALSLLAVSANAADMYRAPEGGGYKDGPVYEPVWTGFYAGVNGGYGWSADDSSIGVKNSQVVRQGTVSGSEAFKTDGGFGGGQIGYNWQPVGGGYKDGPALSHFVFGIEADIQGSGIDGSGAVSVTGASASASNDLDWFGTVRGRAGYAAGTSLFYVTGGFAFGGVKDSLTVASKTVSSDTTDTGYVLGGGVEHLFSPRWSAKVEYQYIDLGSDKITATSGTSSATLNAEHVYNSVRLGLNYHFGTSYEPLK